MSTSDPILHLLEHPAKLYDFLESRCTEKEREAVQIVFVEEKGIRAAAKILDVTPTAVRDRLDSVRRKANREFAR